MAKFLWLALFYSAYVTTSRACIPLAPTIKYFLYDDDSEGNTGSGPISAVSLQATNEQNRHFCGASIIHPKFLLSAAHCFNGTYDVPNIRAVAGEHSLTLNDHGEQIRRVTRIIKHENYNAQTLDNDIALLELNEPLNFDDKYVRSVGLWDSAWELPQWATVSGWGLINAPESQAPRLATADIRVRDHGDCARKYRALNNTITSNMICAGGLRDACQGDGGAPLTCLKRLTSGQTQRHLCGIVSWGVYCTDPANKLFPSVYTDVSKYKEWVQRNMAGRTLLSG